MRRRPPISTVPDTLFPYTTLFRAAGVGLGSVHRGRAPRRRRLSALGVSRAAVVARGRGTPRHLRGIGQRLREWLPPDAGVPAAGGIPRTCSQDALREHADEWRGLARAAAKIGRAHV